MGERYFKNPFNDYKPGVNVKFDKIKILNLIENYTQQIYENFPPNKYEDAELYVGSAGIAFMFLYLSKSKQIPDELKLKSINYANEYINVAKQKQIRHQKEYCGFLCGSAGIHAVAAGIALATTTKNPNEKLIENEIKLFEKGFDICLKEFSSSGCDELFVGRAGYLNGCYWLNEQFQQNQPISTEKMIEICEKIIQSGRNYSINVKSKFPLMYNYHGTEYLGAAHGICSIYHMLLNSPLFDNSINTKDHENSKKYIRESIDTFLDLQTPTGNFPVKITEKQDRHRDRELIHWCHGAPGAIYLLLKSYLIFNDQRYLDSAIKAADLIWTNGLLKKGPGICHGIAGNGYPFLCLYRLTNNEKYLYRAQCFMEFLTNEQFISDANQPDCPYSLYEGIAGTVCFLVDLLQPEQAEFPFLHI